jgi:2-oxoglutarate dehydrogenase E2 component (dihydrolipoamide succinyltransferase)
MEIRIPHVGESVFEALVAKWLKKSGELVEKDDPVCEIETDKVTMELNAEETGILSITVEAGKTVKIGTVIGEISAAPKPSEALPTAPGTEQVTSPQRHLSPSDRKAARKRSELTDSVESTRPTVEMSMPGDEQGLLFTQEVHSEEPAPYKPAPAAASASADGRTTRQPMTPIRRRIAERLLAARQQTAMLTTFNEADMGRLLELKKKHGDAFHRRHGVKLGLMPFFVKACIEALEEFPAVNASIEDDDIVYHHYHDIGIAVSGEKGLVVPVLRDAGRLHFSDIERGIEDYVDKVRSNRIALSDLEGGTFTISNGGIFGSLLSTPILNPPQSGVLGMHAIQERPVARKGKVVIRPMMYLALSYDHRIIDGREAVQFLKKVIEYIEEPEEMLLEG